MNGPITTKKTYHLSNILKHYAHAKEKHPYFCDKIAPVDLDKEDKEGLADYRESVKRRLSDMRSDIEVLIKKAELGWSDLVLCELWEVDEAIANGDTAHAVEECYDAIAVLLRTIDVLEGRQKLGKPGEESKGDDRLDNPEYLLDFLEKLPKCKDFIFQDEDAKGYWTITNEWLCGTIAGRGFCAATKEEAAKQLIDYLNEHINHKSIVGHAVTNSGWPNKWQVLNYIDKPGKGEGK